MPTPPLVRAVEREAVAFRALWRGWLLSVVLTPLLFLGAMGFGLGGLIEENRGEVAGLSYLDFLTPGLLAASVMQVAAQESLWPIMVGTKWLGTFHSMVATPLRPIDVFDGFLAWAALRAVATAVAFLAIAALLGGVPSPWAVVAVPAVALTALAFASPLAAFAVSRESDASFPMIVRLGVLPLFLFSGTFFPVEQLPDRLEPLAVLSPLWHGVEVSRAATTGALDASALLHGAVLVAAVAAGRLWATRSFPRKLTP